MNAWLEVTGQVDDFGMAGGLQRIGWLMDVCYRDGFFIKNGRSHMKTAQRAYRLRFLISKARAMI